LIDLTGKRALVTGASKGIGAACALAIARAGAAVAVHYNKDAKGAKRIVDEARAIGRVVEALAADLSRWDEGEKLVARAEQAVGPLDVVVLNHGIWKEAAIDRMTERDYDETMDANLRGVFSVAGACARRMKPRKTGRILLIASTAGQRGEALHAHYAATKGAVISFTKSLAAELAPAGVLVNCVAPGWVATDMTAPTLANDRDRETVLGTIPLRRVGTPEEIAGPVLFLASDLATFITGEILNVNGGAVLVG
jgi:3-oxoacyl-[acyl-carrier protein] reductase